MGYYKYATPTAFRISAVASRSGMANTYTQIYIHVVFAVEGRQNLIQPAHNAELQKYITGVVTAKGQKLIAINNMPDHLHLLVGLRPDSSLSDLIRDIKANSSRFIAEMKWVVGKFSWQQGFGAFSCSRSQLGPVIRYIEDQQRHHTKKTFQEEYIAFLERFGIDYDKKYIFKPAD
ncbi:MAG TPA: IS200/IS605 family transposase [Verrucomicrobiae bacterium]|nr:IS200/IS605 family transposase [Verrucomicrobiae bacterium]